MKFALLLLVLAAPGLGQDAAPKPDLEGVEFFEKKIRPVLVDRCYSCHSAEAKKLKGNLYLDTREGTLKGGDLGPSVVPGDPDKSLLIKAILYTDQDLKMPPKGRLPVDVVADFTAWIKRGAPDPRAKSGAAKAGIDLEAGRKWWAFQKPIERPLPAGKGSPIDRYIQAKLEEKGLKPAAPADRRALIRRATYDLTGLAPAPEDVEAFVHDPAPDAFAKVVERLLATPQYGEKWGRHWLDVVRYTDSNDQRGMFGNEDVAEAWRYRDWVIDAFNRDLPYDQFVKMQIAGDLLPGGFSVDGTIATGMFAIGAWGNGDADKEKMLTDIVDDQIDVLGRAFLGLTFACARCHDHKFDPILTEDYYGLAGIFFSSHILPNPGPKTNGAQMLKIPLAPPAEVEARRKHAESIANLEKKLEKDTDAAWAAIGKDLVGRTAELLRGVAEYRALSPRPAQSEFAAQKGLPSFGFSGWLSYLGTGDLGLMLRASRDIHGKPGLHAWNNASGADTPSATVNTTDRELAFSTIKMPPHSVAVHPSPNAGAGVGWKSPISGLVKVNGKVVDADPNCGDGIEWTLDHVMSGTMNLAKGAIPNGGTDALPERAATVKEGDLLQLVILPKKEYTCDTTVVELVITELEGQKRSWTLSHDVVEGARAGSQANPMGVWCFYDMAKKSGSTAIAPGSALAAWQAGSGDADAVQAALFKPDAAKSPEAKLLKDLTDPKGPFLGAARKDDAALSQDTREALAKLRAEIAELKKSLPPAIPVAHGMQEGGCPQSAWAGIHDAPIHIRGRYDRLGPVIARRFPRVLAGDQQAAAPAKQSGRLELAQWVASAENPLTAKVMANRIWQGHFGEGIVRTANNYGKLGTPPSHPELLDWLALEFVKSGWSLKSMHRLIMLSSTYQQSSSGDPATVKADPGNAFFGRVGRRRLTAEELRDSLLAAGDTLDRTMKGLSVKDLASGRRTMYVTTVRSDRSTYKMLFDAADPGAIVEHRIDSTVAPQALFLLNHPFAMAQARALARRAAAQAGDETARIQWLYALLYGRPATDREAKIGLAMLSRSREGEKLAGAGPKSEDLWEPYCQVLLCSNEFIYVD